MKRDNVAFNVAFNYLPQQMMKVDYYPFADAWSEVVKGLHKSGWLDLMRWNMFLDRSVVLDALPYLEYPKPEFGITEVTANGGLFPVVEEVTINAPFVELRHFRVDTPYKRKPVLIVAPLSGHHATLLRETVRTFLRDFNVYITDWKNVRHVPLSLGAFGLDDYVNVVREYIELLGKNGDLTVVAVCQPSVPVIGAVSLQAQCGGVLPKNTVLIGGPVDTRRNPTEVNDFAQKHSLEWFEQYAVHTAPFHCEGHGRKVVPGVFLLKGMMALDPNRHVEAHRREYACILSGNHEEAMRHRRFYQEYLSTVDLSGKYYLDTNRVVFKEQLLPKGTWEVFGELVRPEMVKWGRLITIEGENDTFVGQGQTEAAHGILKNIPAANKLHHLAKGVGHYGVFAGRTFSEEIYEKVIKPFLFK